MDEAFSSTAINRVVGSGLYLDDPSRCDDGTFASSFTIQKNTQAHRTPTDVIGSDHNIQPVQNDLPPKF